MTSGTASVVSGSAGAVELVVVSPSVISGSETIVPVSLSLLSATVNAAIPTNALAPIVADAI